MRANSGGPISHEFASWKELGSANIRPVVGAMWRVCGLTLLLSGCSALVDPDVDSLGVEPLACRPGETRACPCSSDVLGMQQCNAGGSYDACICPPVAGSGSQGQGRR